MYVHLGIFFKAQSIALFHRRFRPKRWLLIGLFTWLFWINWWIIAFGQALDWVLFPGFRRQPVRAPIFIVATPRSGTTFTHRLMSLDEEQFTTLKLYQTIWPAVCYLKLFALLGRLDRRLGRPFGRFAGFCERRFFGGWKDIHPMGFDKAEEDEGLFTHTLVTPAIYLLFPFMRELRGAGFADDLPAPTRRRMMRFYAGCLKRHLYATGRDKVLLSKNTLFSGRIQSVMEAFPDARIVYLVRHPYEVVPSHVSMFHLTWRTHSPEIAKDSPESMAYAQLAVDYYLHMLAWRDRIPPGQYVDLRYDELIADPRRAIERIYERLGLPVSEAFRARLAAATERARSYQSQHAYALEEYGLSRAWIDERLGPVLEAYFPTRGREEGKEARDSVRKPGIEEARKGSQDV